jgi:hypothetical protein
MKRNQMVLIHQFKNKLLNICNTFWYQRNKGGGKDLHYFAIQNDFFTLRDEF